MIFFMKKPGQPEEPFGSPGERRKVYALAAS